MLHTIRKFVRSLGFDVIRYTAATSRDLRFARTFQHFGIDLILDVGANTGGFAEMVFALDYAGKIVSFEPMAKEHQTLLRKSKGNPRWQVFERCALGDADGEIEINVAGNSVSSSILPILDAHTQAAPQSKYVAKEKTPLYRLDTIAPQILSPQNKTLLKIDAQGFESQVLAGAAQTLKQIRVVQLEMSFVPLYQGQALYADLLEQLAAHGFEMYSLTCGLTDEQTGKMLQADGIFVKK